MSICVGERHYFKDEEPEVEKELLLSAVEVLVWNASIVQRRALHGN